MPSTKSPQVKPKNAKTVDEYFAMLTEDRRAELQQLRELIHQTVPGSEEAIQHGMPTFEIDGCGCAVASQKHYMCLYLSTEVLAKYKASLAHLDCGKCCIRFKKFDDLPLKAVKAMLRQSAKSKMC